VIYYLRGIAVSFSIFFVLYGVLSAAVWFAWRQIWRFAQRYSAECCADLLFALRIAPFVVATGVTLAFTVPSFLLLEPRGINEQTSGLSLVLGLSGVGVALTGMWRATVAFVKASQIVSHWSSDACPIESSPFRDSVPVSLVSSLAPPLTVSGILRCRVWLSRSAEFVLTEQELETALRHEAMHVRRRDNLRRLILHFVGFPGITELETAWREASEMAADDAAVSNESEALDLAAALVKLTELVSPHPPTELTAALVRSPAECFDTRVRRLIAWPERQKTAARAKRLRYAACAGAGAAMLAVAYGQLLVKMHEATEFLVR
jgi:beta-lactamase regulating signal transducer with metallopeptidase domain